MLYCCLRQKKEIFKRNESKKEILSQTEGVTKSVTAGMWLQRFIWALSSTSAHGQEIKARRGGMKTINAGSKEQ